MSGTVKLVAKTRVKFGGKAAPRMEAGPLVLTEPHKEFEPGQEFEADADTAEQLILAGAAMSPEDYKAEVRTQTSNEEKAREMRDEINEAETKRKAREGDTNAITSNAHLAAQDKEEAMIADAQKSAKGKKTDDTETKKK